MRANLHGHPLQVCIPFETVQRVFSADGTFPGLCHSVSKHLDVIYDAAWQHFSRNHHPTISLTQEDLGAIPPGG